MSGGACGCGAVGGALWVAMSCAQSAEIEFAAKEGAKKKGKSEGNEENIAFDVV